MEQTILCYKLTKNGNLNLHESRGGRITYATFDGAIKALKIYPSPDNLSVELLEETNSCRVVRIFNERYETIYYLIDISIPAKEIIGATKNGAVHLVHAT